MPSSRLSGFYQLSLEARLAQVADWAGLDAYEVAVLAEGMGAARGDKMIENVVGRFDLPLGIGVNFTVNGCDYLIPMVVEEPSVVAAVSFAAKLARAGGGFRTGSTEPVMIAQVQLLDVPDLEAAAAAILAAKGGLLAAANTSPTIAKLGGGPVDLEVHILAQTPTVPMLIVHLLFDVRDAMGANAVNTAAEAIAPQLEALSGGRGLLRILSNLSDRRRAWAEVLIPASAFAVGEFSGREVVQGIAHANAFAVADPYRAATHNKGIFNGIDAVALATGNDWRAIEAGAHAYAVRDGQYRALTDWCMVAAPADLPVQAVYASASGVGSLPEEFTWPGLYGRVELPLAVGIVGGATRSHPVAQVALKILGVTSARDVKRSHGRGRVGAELGGAARVGHRRHPARAYGATCAASGHRRGGNRDRGRPGRRKSGARGPGPCRTRA